MPSLCDPTLIHSRLQLISDKQKRTEFHAAIRQLFDGTFETFARDVPGETGSRIAIKWGMTPEVAKRTREKHDRQKQQKEGKEGRYPTLSFCYSPLTCLFSG